ncbi:MAG: glycosyltransferase [Candidatus Didemnitutus sp.]|nr:glycosyltransferase [Candidatus Didemnitutus sp.]
MTATYKIPPSHESPVTLRSKPVDPANIHAIIPTYNDWDGAKTTIDSLLRMRPAPRKITVVDDNRIKNPPAWISDQNLRHPSVHLAASYEGNIGPAYARNIGFGFHPEQRHDNLLIGGSERERYVRHAVREPTSDSRLVGVGNPVKSYVWKGDSEWYYFTDSGCEHAEGLLQHFADAWQDTGDSCVAISGPVEGAGDGLINRFMTEQGILNPPKARLLYDIMLPQALVTANALVSGLAFSFVGGFDETFKIAAGEDLDLGIRLRRLGLIGWAEQAKVTHRFPEELPDFDKRFERYGAGNRQLELKHRLPSLRARKFKAELPDLQDLADRQVAAMQRGYDRAVDPKVQGKITLG